MYIVYDARHFEDYYSGLSRYSFSVLKELIISGNYKKIEIILNSNYNYKNNPLFLQIEKITTNLNVNFVYLDANIFSIKQHVTVAKYVNKSNCDRYFYPHFDSPLFIKRNVLFVIHDLFPLVLKSYVLRHAFLKKLYFKLIIHGNLIKKNTHCISVSKTTKKDLITYFGKKYTNKIEVIYEDSFSDNENIDIDINKVINIVGDKKFLFYIGGRRRHKNLKQMLDIFNILIQENLYDGYFIIAGSKKDFYFNLEEYIQNNNKIIILGKVSDSELSYLYSKMDSLFFLSKYEGFGLPIIESAKQNKKIITTTLGACDEIAPDNSLKLDINLDNKYLASLISEYINLDMLINNASYLKNYTWSNTVNYMIEKKIQ